MPEEQIRFAVAMRMGRAALGLNQQEFAQLLGVSKSTVARTETLEMAMRADTLMTMLRVLRERGVEIDLIGDEQRVSVQVQSGALKEALERLRDEEQRRPDRQRKSPKLLEQAKAPKEEGPAWEKAYRKHSGGDSGGSAGEES